MHKLLKKRDEKIKSKSDKLKNKAKFAITPEEKEIMKKVKSKKKNAKREKSRETDEFDAILDKYKNKVLKKFKKSLDGPKNSNDVPFEVIEMSD